jgi:CYTH domain-containing protein
MKKKTPTKTISTLPSKDDLPIIRIVSEEEEMHVKLELEMEDETHDMLVKWGKEVATDEDYINIAITDGLKHGISSDK